MAIINRTALLIVLIILSTLQLCLVSEAFSFKDIKKKITEGTDFANKLLGESGEIPRESGCIVKWNIQGTVRGIEWKWICTCRDTCTGIVEVHTKSSRDGAMEHCLTALFQKLARQGL